MLSLLISIKILQIFVFKTIILNYGGRGSQENLVKFLNFFKLFKCGGHTKFVNENYWLCNKPLVNKSVVVICYNYKSVLSLGNTKYRIENCSGLRGVSNLWNTKC